MNFSDIIRTGDKIDIYLTSENERQKEESAPKFYKSIVEDVDSDDELRITMPMVGMKLVLLETGSRISMIFYTKRGVYNTVAIVRERYKEGTQFFLKVQGISPLKKFQRREYFRISKMIDFKYWHISEEVASLPTTEQLFITTQDPENNFESQKGTILDISGGGIRFTSEEQLDKDSYILSAFRLKNENFDTNFYLVTQILDSVPAKNGKECYINRSQFVLKNIKDREAIVKFIFEEERLMRKKEIR